MSDIGSRIHRYRLSRYAPPIDRVRRRLRWAWVVGILWLIWISVGGDHSLWRIFRLERENARARTELTGMRGEIDRLDQQIHDPRVGREIAEKALREKNGMARPNEIVYRIRGGTVPDSAR
jgi:cell division protein FtsB